jgi:hypothetical protein
MLINVDGKQSKVTRVIEGREARAAQIYPNHLQININNASGIQMPESAWNHLKDGGSVIISGNRYSDLKI